MLGHRERSRLHRRAAHALWSAGAPANEAADHLMHADGEGEAWATEVLRRAAGGTPPAAAAGYLRRALDEDAAAGRRGDLLAELAAAELSGGGSDAARHLAEAIDLLPPGEQDGIDENVLDVHVGSLELLHRSLVPLHLFQQVRTLVNGHASRLPRYEAFSG